MAKKLKAALIGCGSISGAHAGGYQAIADKVELAYCIDLIRERAENRKAEYGTESTVCLTDYKEMLADESVDIVSICLPNHLHAQVSIDCLNAGKHVLCEKPAAMNYAEALAMKEAADKNGKILNIGVVNRFNRGVERVREAIQNGELGEVYQIYCSFRAFRSIPALGKWFTTKALAGGGALIDWGVHFLDLINYCVDAPKIKTVSAVCHSKLATDMRDYKYRAMHAGPPDYDGTYDVEEFVTGLVRTEGPTLTFNGAWAQNIDEEAMFVEFIGTKGGIKLQYGQHYTLYTERDGEFVTEKPDFEIPSQFRCEIAAFADCAEKGEKIRSNIDEVLITAKLMDAIYKSAALGREVTVD